MLAWAVGVAQLTGQSLPNLQILGLNPYIGKMFSTKILSKTKKVETSYVSLWLLENANKYT